VTPISETLLKENGWLPLQINWIKEGRTLYYHNNTWKINGKSVKYMEQLANDAINERKYLPTFSVLLDTLTIDQLKQVKIPEHRALITDEIDSILHDIQLIINESSSIKITSDLLRDVIILAQYNTHIWYNETNIRNGIREGNNLELTHGLNNIRNLAKNRIESALGGRKEYKKDNVQPFPEWVPSGY
jgi:hypothetical protein